MKLRFWNRWKREKKNNDTERSKLLRGEKAQINIVKFEPINDETLEKRNRHKLHVTEIPILEHLTKEDQCHGKLKSGARCSRVVKKAMYCYQHKRR